MAKVGRTRSWRLAVANSVKTGMLAEALVWTTDPSFEDAEKAVQEQKKIGGQTQNIFL